MDERIVKNVGDCEVTIIFSGHNDDLRDKVLWALTESYQERVSASDFALMKHLYENVASDS